MFNSKAISGVASVLLLLSATIVALIAFQFWYTGFTNDLISNVDPLVSKDDIKLLEVSQDYIWVRSFTAVNVSYDDIKIDGVSCSTSGQIRGNSVNNLSIGSCSTQANKTSEVSIFSPSGIFSGTIKVIDFVLIPIVNFDSNLTVVNFGDSINLTWSVSNAQTCVATGDWSGSKNSISGSELDSGLITSTTYNLNCTSSTGHYTESSVSITVCPVTHEVVDGVCTVQAIEIPYVYSISNSLMFNDDDSAYLSRTPSIAGNRKTWTWSGWVKRSGLSSQQMLFTTGDGTNNNWGGIIFGSTNTINIKENVGGVTKWNIETNSLYRDTSSWVNIIIKYDSTQSTSSDRVKLYVDGNEVTSLSSSSYPTQNYESFISSTTYSHSLGKFTGSTYYFDGYLSDVNFIDGAALGPEYFGENDSYGNWIPKLYSGTYGTNGFYLSFVDSSNLGADYSGNSNNWTLNNLASSDYSLDSPKRNYATINPLDTFGGNTPTLSQGNTYFTRTGATSDNQQAYATLPANGKNYFEFNITGNSNSIEIGFLPQGETSGSEGSGESGWDVTPVALLNMNAAGGGGPWNLRIYDNTGSGTTTTLDSSEITTTPRLKFAIDTGAKKVWLGVVDSTYGGWIGPDGTAQLDFDENNPTITYTEDFEMFPYVYGHAQTESGWFYFTENKWTDTAPSGFKPITVGNVRSQYKEIVPTDYFDVKLYTGTGSSQDITGLSFSPDLVWIKDRDYGYSNNLFDTTRGVGYVLYTDDTSGGGQDLTRLSAFLSSGFTVGTAGATNSNGERFVSWNWVKSPLTFDIVLFNHSTGTPTIVSHSLGKTPSLIITKQYNLTSAGWWNWHKGLSNENYGIGFGTGTEINYGSSTFSPNSTHITFNSAYSSSKVVGYLFSEQPGFSKIGNYSGNGGSEGPFIYTGFKPAYVMIKPISGTTGSGVILDTKRSTYNPRDESLEADNSNAESANRAAIRTDFLSNGFKIRSSDGQVNSGSGKYIYIAFAEEPMGGFANPNPALSANTTTVLSGSSINLSWEGRYSNRCEAAGNWSDFKLAGDDSEIISSLTSTSTFNLTCSNTDRNVNSTDSVTVTVCEEGQVILDGSCVTIGGQSLLFNDDDSAYLSKTFGSAGNRTTWTWSGWVKRANIKGDALIYTSGDYPGGGANDVTSIGFSDDYFEVAQWSSGYDWTLRTNAIFRDPNEWTNFVVSVDTRDSTSTERVKLWVNGIRITDFVSHSGGSAVWPSQNLNTDISGNSFTHYLGKYAAVSSYFDGSLSEVNFIDGQALGPENFGYNDSYGVWQSKQYDGIYGTNGFYLPFTDSSNIGNDLSGNNNDWTANNLASSDFTSDGPVSNYATWNPLDKGSGITLANGNLKVTASSDNHGAKSTLALPSNGKVYAEFKLTTSVNSGTGLGPKFGIARENKSLTSGTWYDWVWYKTPYGGSSQGALKTDPNSNSVTTTGLTMTDNGDYVQIAWDSGKWWVGINNVWLSSGDPNTGSNPLSTLDTNQTWFFHFVSDLSNGGLHEANFGQGGFSGVTWCDDAQGYFKYCPPTGFKSLTTQYINEVEGKVNASEFFDVALWSGTGGSTNRNITGLNFKPGIVWMKSRSAAESHQLFDVARGVINMLSPDASSAESSSNGLLNFLDNGFTIGSYSSGSNMDTSGHNYVAWTWKTNDSYISNNDGSVSSNISVNNETLVSVVSFNSGASGDHTIGHGLGTVPAFFFIKSRDSSSVAASNWYAWHTSLPSATASYMNLVDTSALGTYSGTWGISGATSTTLGYNVPNAASANQKYIAYVFAEKEGFSKFGSYTGNGNADGPFIYTGFKPAYIMIKPTGDTQSWRVWDNKRTPINPIDGHINADENIAESTIGSAAADLLSNGFKLRTSNSAWNTNGGTYIYIAFAEEPLN